MANPYARPGGTKGLFAPTSTQNIIGAEEDKRSTKTFISSEKAAIILALIKNHAENVARTVKALWMHENPGKGEPSVEELAKRFRGVRAWRDAHQQLAEHFASNQGFSVKAAVRMSTLEEDQGSKVESSIDAGKHDGKTNGVVKTAAK